MSGFKLLSVLLFVAASCAQGADGDPDELYQVAPSADAAVPQDMGGALASAVSGDAINGTASSVMGPPVPVSTSMPSAPSSQTTLSILDAGSGANAGNAQSGGQPSSADAGVSADAGGSSAAQDAGRATDAATTDAASSSTGTRDAAVSPPPAMCSPSTCNNNCGLLQRCCNLSNECACQELFSNLCVLPSL